MASFQPAQLKHWVEKCEHDHHVCREACAKNTEDLDLSVRFDEAATSNFRLFDIKRNYIVPSPLDARYIALSYSGMADELRLTTSNYDNLTTDGAP
ncbi:hypothetical protein Sste5346_009661 [Sporothrix stenoceras]|uniref:Uncharacterized protein n=1 Tax=Sporothrix stenoceras TaxID=5173 RepID=A0ABR3YJD1_9PEZI